MVRLNLRYRVDGSSEGNPGGEDAAGRDPDRHKVLRRVEPKWYRTFRRGRSAGGRGWTFDHVTYGRRGNHSLQRGAGDRAPGNRQRVGENLRRASCVAESSKMTV